MAAPTDPGVSLPRMRVLLVEDDASMADLLRRALTRQGYAVDRAATGVEALELAAANGYDAILLDVMIPAPDGFTVLSRLRGASVRTPVLMLTALGEVEDRVAGLDWGADDYLAKPFKLSELFARLRAVTRRGPAEHLPVLRCGTLSLDPGRHEVSRYEQPITLSGKEFALLEELMRRPGRVVSRALLLHHVWESDADPRSNVIEVNIRQLREKVDRPWGLNTIETVRGYGYRLSCGTERAVGGAREWQPPHSRRG